MDDKIMKQVSENEDTAIKLLNDVKRLRTGLNEIREYIDNDFNRFDCFGSMAVSMEMNYKREELLKMIDKLLESKEN